MKKPIRGIWIFVTVLLVLFAFAVGTEIEKKNPSIRNPKYYDVVGAYTGTAGKTFGSRESYQIGRNSVGNPVFKDPEAAFQQALKDYRAGFEEIQREYGLLGVSRHNWRSYEIYGWQLTTQDENLLRQGGAISGFFDIYENSFE